MIPILVALLAVAPVEQPAAVPASVIIATARGEKIVPVRVERGHPALPVPYLAGVLPMTAETKEGWADVTFAGQSFRFLLEAPAFVHGDRVVPLAGGAYLFNDTLFLPLQWLADYIPSVLSEGYHYDPLAGRFEEARAVPVAARAQASRSSTPVPAPSSMPARPAARPRGPARVPPSGVLRFPHTVVVDAGHGGDDPGNPGLHLPGNLREKDVTLAISKQLRTQLMRRGVDVVMTRMRDTLIDLRDRGKFCHDDCDLFVSIHVNSLLERWGFESVGGLETYFLADARTGEEKRVANMENEALRYEAGFDPGAADALGFILKDLQTNEYLRESALLADLVQGTAGRVHPNGSRGVSQAGFMVLTTARRPAVLVEVGYSTNRTDGRFIASGAGQERLAGAIADAIVSYFQRYEGKIAGVEP